jgi:hypothetical protein
MCVELTTAPETVLSSPEKPENQKIDHLLEFAKVLRPLAQELLTLNAAIDQKAKAMPSTQPAWDTQPAPVVKENPRWVTIRQHLIQETPEGKELRNAAKKYRETYEKSGYHDSTKELLQWLEFTEELPSLAERITEATAQGKVLELSQLEETREKLAHDAQESWRKDSGYTERWKLIEDDEFINTILRDLQTATPDQLQQPRFKTFRLAPPEEKNPDADPAVRQSKILDAKKIKDLQITSIKDIPEGFSPETDIQHLTQEELPQNRKEQNYRGVDLALKIILEAIKSGEKIDAYWLEKTAANIHTAWVNENSYVRDTLPGQKDYAKHLIQRLDYYDPGFTEEEKNKDRTQIMAVLRGYAEAL